MLTSPSYFGILSSHTVTTEQNTGKDMRTKTLLIAAAALAIGVATSMAQTYSQNIVGYVSIVVPGNQGTTLICNPLTNSVGNDLGTLFTNAPKNTVVWEYGSGIWNPYTRRANGTFSGGYDGHAILPGEGIIVQTASGAANLTNTFVGQVIQGTNIVAFVPGGFSTVSCVSPVSGLLQTTLGYPATKNDVIWTYDPVTSWQSSTRRASSWSGSYYTGTPGVDAAGEPVILPGQAFFIQAAATASGSWTNVFVPAP